MKKVWDAVRKDLWIVVLDIIAVNASYLLALLIRFFVNGAFRPIVTNSYLPAFWQFAPFYTVACIVIFIAFRLYGGMWTYAGLNDMKVPDILIKGLVFMEKQLGCISFVP